MTVSEAQTITSAQALTLALQKLNAGQAAEAERISREVLAALPGAPDAMHILGLALHEQGKFGVAVDWLEKSAQANPADPHIDLHLGLALEAHGRTEGAERAYRRYHERHPDDGAACCHLARVLQRLGRADEAIDMLRKHVSRHPGDRPCCLALGQAYHRLWRLEDGIAHYRHVVSADAGFTDAWNNLGNLLRDAGKLEEAAAAYRRAIDAEPGNAIAHANLGNIFLDCGDFDQARAWYDKALDLQPGYAAARLLRCMTTLPMIYRDPAEIDAARRSYADALDELVAYYTQDHPEQLGDLGRAIGRSQPFFLSYQQQDDRTLQQRYGDLACRATAAAYARWTVAADHRPRGEPDGRLRILFISAYFRGHSVWKAITRGWLEKLDRSKYLLIGYHTEAKRDSQTAYAEKLFERFVQGPLETEQWLDLVRNDDPHLILYPEVGMDPTTARLAACRLAPVQCVAWGHPETTGYATIDYFLAGELLESEAGGAAYTERLVRLAGTSSFYQFLSYPAGACTRETLGLAPNDVVYLCCQNLFKYLPQFDDVFPRIAESVPDARFIFFRHKTAKRTGEIFEQRIREAFAARGVAFEAHCRFMDWMEVGQFEAAQRCMDVYLDSIGFSGFNTAIEALRAGLPVVTVAGDNLRGRLASAVLRQIGIVDTIAANADEFIDIAIRLGNDAGLRRAVAKRIEQALPRAIGARNAITALESFIDHAATDLKGAPTELGVQRLQGEAVRLQMAGRYAEAEKIYRKVLAIQPKHTAALSNLGAALRKLGHVAEAVKLYRQAIEINPDYADAWFNLGRALIQQGKLGQGIEAYKRAASLYGDTNAQALSNLGDALRSANLPAEGLVYAKRAVEIDPRHVEARLNLANTYRDLGWFDIAHQTYLETLSLRPNYAAARLQDCNLMVPQTYRSQDDVLPARERYRTALEELEDYYLRQHPDELVELGKIAAISQPFYLAYQGMNDRELLSRYGGLISRAVAATYGEWALPQGHVPKPDPEGKLRIGIVSGLFRDHSVWKAIVKGWVEQLDPRRFALYAYYTQAGVDAETALIRDRCRRFVQGPKESEDWCRIIRHDDLHLVIYPETGMDPESAKLAALRLAPVQCVTWGHPETSGLPTIDYYLSGDLLEPADADEHYSEKLIRLPGTSACYAPIAHRGSTKRRSDFGLGETDVVFLSCQMPFKYLPKYDEVFPRIAREVPNARLMFFKHRKSEGLNEVFQSRLRAAFERAGVSFEKHVVISGWLSFDDFQALLGVADVFLDTIGFSGFNTAMEALTAGLPIVTLEGEFMRGRLAAAIYRQIGMADAVAHTVDEFVAQAADLGNSRQRREAWRTRIRSSLPRAWNDTTPVRALEDFLVKAIGNSVAKAPPPPVWQLLTADPGSDAHAYNHAYVPKGLIALLGHPPRNVLDIGCFVGATGAFVKKQYPGARVVGIEPNAQAAAHAGRKLDYVANCILDEFDWQAAGFERGMVDTVILADVLEHLYSPWAALLALKPWLSADAQVMISLPNVRNILLLNRTLAQGQWTYERAGLLDVTHIRFFTRSEAIRMFEETGYRVEAVSANPDARLQRVAATDFRGRPTTTLETDRLTLKDVTPQELAELTTLQFFFRCAPIHR